jgi:hypothetical protein
MTTLLLSTRILSLIDLVVSILTFRTTGTAPTVHDRASVPICGVVVPASIQTGWWRQCDALQYLQINPKEKIALENFLACWLLPQDSTVVNGPAPHGQLNFFGDFQLIDLMTTGS